MSRLCNPTVCIDGGERATVQTACRVLFLLPMGQGTTTNCAMHTAAPTPLPTACTAAEHRDAHGAARAVAGPQPHRKGRRPGHTHQSAPHLATEQPVRRRACWMAPWKGGKRFAWAGRVLCSRTRFTQPHPCYSIPLTSPFPPFPTFPILPHPSPSSPSFPSLTSMSGLEHCTSLEELYLSHNGISTLEGLAPLGRLKILDVSSNRITQLHVADLVALTQVRCRGLC